MAEAKPQIEAPGARQARNRGWLREAMDLPRGEYSAEEQLLFEMVRALRRVRKNAGLSQREVADAMGVPQSNVARLESLTNKRVPNLATVAKYLAACNVHLSLEPNTPDAADPLISLSPELWAVENEENIAHAGIPLAES